MAQNLQQILPVNVALPAPPGGWLTSPPKKIEQPIDYLCQRAKAHQYTTYKGIPFDFLFSEGNPPVTIRLPPQFFADYPEEWPSWIANPMDRNIRKNIRVRFNEWLAANKEKIEKEHRDYNNYVDMFFVQAKRLHDYNIESHKARLAGQLQSQEQILRTQLLTESQQSEQNIELKKANENAALAAAAATAATAAAGTKKQQQQQSKQSVWTNFKLITAPKKPADKDLLPQRHLDPLIKDILGETMKCAPEAEKALTVIAEDFVSSAFQFGASIAKGRHDKTIKPGDLTTYFRRYWNLEVPSQATEGLRYKYNRLRFGEEHKARLAGIREATLTGGAAAAGELENGGGIAAAAAAGGGGMKKGVKRKAGAAGHHDDEDGDDGVDTKRKR